MRRNFLDAARLSRFSLALSSCLLVMLLVLAAAAGQHVQFSPKFSPGQILRYSVESRTTTTGKTTAPIVNPEGGSQSKELIHLLVRLDVLDARPSTAPGGAAVRLRATYEKSSAESEGDALDPNAASLSDQYGRLEGHSFNFTIGPTGDIADFQGLDNAFPDRSAAEPVLSWLQNMSPGNAFPRNGISIGQKWKSGRPLAGAPLTGLIWHTESTYLRNEPCHPSSVGGTANGNEQGRGSGTCAVILTRFEILRTGSARSDATPEEYLRNGLRTSGTWTGSGESLDAISLATGLLVTSTETSTQNIDYKITSASAGTSIRHEGQIQSQSQIKLMPDQM